MRCVFVGLFTVVMISWSASAQLSFPDGSEQATAYLGGGDSRHNVVYVSSSGTDVQNGTALLNALSNITDAGESNRYLIQLDPGDYDLDDSTLNTKSWVHIRGTGRLDTVITSSASVAVEGADLAVLSFLTLTNTSTSSTVYQLTSGDTFLLYVRMVVAPTTTSNSFGVFVDGTNAIIQPQNCSIEYEGTSSGAAVYGARIQGTGSKLEMENCFVDLTENGSVNAAIGLRATTGNALDVERTTVEVKNYLSVAFGIYVTGQTDLDYCRVESSGDALYQNPGPLNSDNYNIFLSDSNF